MARRIPVRGGGPLLREPMTLELGPPGTLRRGDMIAFRYGDRRLAHRIVWMDGGEVWTASDARPWEIERVRPGDVLAKVTAVWSDDSPAARRVDGPLYRIRAGFMVYAHPLHAWVAQRADSLTGLLRCAHPRRRDRTALRTIGALRAAREGDRDALACALHVDLERLRAFDLRHQCLGIIGTAAQRTMGAAAVPAELVETLRGVRLSGVFATSRLQRVLCATIGIVRETGTPFALLKGAARVYTAAPDAALHPSQDIDVLVPEDDVDRVVAALLARGYRYHEHDDATPEQYRRRHHHAASLFPPGGEFPIEVHHALAPPGSIALRTGWDALTPYLRPWTGAAGEVFVLDPVGTALHLAIHAIGLTRLRDVALLAQALDALSAGERTQLAALVRAETVDRVRLDAGLVLAARLAGVPWPSTERVERYLRWALTREDMPRFVRQRCETAESFFAHPGELGRGLGRLVPWWSQGPALLLVPQRIVGRVLANLAAWWYLHALARGYRTLDQEPLGVKIFADV